MGNVNEHPKQSPIIWKPVPAVDDDKDGSSVDYRAQLFGLSGGPSNSACSAAEQSYPIYTYSRNKSGDPDALVTQQSSDATWQEAIQKMDFSQTPKTQKVYPAHVDLKGWGTAVTDPLYLQSCGAALQPGLTLRRPEVGDVNNIRPQSVKVNLRSDGTVLGKFAHNVISSKYACVLGMYYDGVKPPKLSSLLADEVPMDTSTGFSRPTTTGASWWVPFRFVPLATDLFVLGMLVANVNGMFFVLSANNPFVQVTGQDALTARGGRGPCVATLDQQLLHLSIVVYGEEPVFALANKKGHIVPQNLIFQLGHFDGRDMKTPVYKALKDAVLHNLFQDPIAHGARITPTLPSQIPSMGSWQLPVWGPLNAAMVGFTLRWIGCNFHMLVLGKAFTVSELVFIFYQGSLLICTDNGMVVWQSGTFDATPGTQLRVEFSGNLEILNSKGRTIWSSGMDNPAANNSFIFQRGPATLCDLNA